MSTTSHDRTPVPADDEPGGEVIPLRPPAAGAVEPVDQPDRGDQAVAEYDTSYDHALDDEPAPLPVVHVDELPARSRHDRKPVIPQHLRTWTGIRNHTRYVTGLTGNRLAYHAVRSWWYALLAAFWAPVGAGKLAGRQLRWFWHPELSAMLQHAADTNDVKEGTKVERQLAARRKARGIWLLAELVLLAAAVVLLLTLTPWWVHWLAAVVLLPLLAHHGRPVDRPIVSAAVVTYRYRRINADIVLRAYYRAGLGHPDKPDEQIKFASKMSRDRYDLGSQVVVDLPYGVTFSDAMKAREKLASGLDVTISQVYLTRDKTSQRRHLLWVADVDPLGIPAGKTPLLDCKPRDIWKKAPLGLDERGRRVAFCLVFLSLLIGAQPRKGKTFTARTLALFAALDPYVRISVFDGKGSPDWRNFALVAYTYGFGLSPNRVQGDPIENLLATLRQANQEVLDRNNRLSELPTDVCPEGKLTRAIARDPRYRMPVWLIVLDEFQDYFSTGDEDVDEEISDLLVRLIRKGPSVGIIIMGATQKPSGLGSTGKVARRFTDFRDNFLARFALKTGSYTVSDTILGNGAYSDGYDSSALPNGDGSDGGFDYRGIGILYEAPVPNATVRTYKCDGPEAEFVLQAARRHRERAGTLDGMAAGLEVVAQPRDPLTDAIDAFRDGETFLSWDTLAGRLGEQQPERYAKVTGEGLSKTLRGLGLGIESKAGAEKGRGEQRLRGVYLAALRRALDTRNSKDHR